MAKYKVGGKKAQIDVHELEEESNAGWWILFWIIVGIVALLIANA